MSPVIHHKGIIYSVEELEKGRWRWSIHPPASVTDYQPASGVIFGNRTAAITRAKLEIDLQDLAHSSRGDSN